MTQLRTHDDVEIVIRSTLLGVSDLKFFEYRPPSGRKSLDVPPQPHVRGYSGRLTQLGNRTAIVCGAYRLPCDAEQLVRDTRANADTALRERDAQHQDSEGERLIDENADE